MPETAEKKIGRPPVEVKRGRQVNGYMYPAEVERLHQLADRLEVSVASVIRRAVLRELALQEAGL